MTVVNEEKTQVQVHVPKKFSFWDKIMFCYYILRYGNSHMRFRRIISCENCGSQAIFSLEGMSKHYEENGRKVFENTYICAQCKSLGKEVQYWREPEIIKESHETV